MGCQLTLNRIQREGNLQADVYQSQEERQNPEGYFYFSDMLIPFIF